MTTVLMGGLVVLYTTLGGIKAVTWADVQQMIVIMLALVFALGVAIWLLPAHVSFRDALVVAGAAGRLNAVDPHFDPSNRYNLWSGLIGGMFLALAYFGTDQSQVQRYLTGKSIGQSRLSLLFNAMAKIPMQFFILFIGAMVFVFFTFEKAPVIFQPVAQKKIERTAEYRGVESRYGDAFEKRREAANGLIAASRSGDAAAERAGAERYRAAHLEFEASRRDAIKLVERHTGSAFNDTNYIFLSFVTHYLPVGVVGLVIAVIFSAAMSAISGEINSLATVTVIDVYRRWFRREATDRHYLWVSRLATAFWGIYAVGFASYGSSFGALIETVNVIGSLFYPGMLGVFVLAFFFKRVGANGAFVGVLACEAVVLSLYNFTSIAFLWYNVIGCVVVVVTGLLISSFSARRAVPG
jgi:Na+/proline symporter